MLEPPLEHKLRNPKTQKETINCLGLRIVDALEQGLSQSPDGDGNDPQATGHQTNPAAG